MSVLADCVFQGIGLYHLGYQICGHRVSNYIPLLYFSSLIHMLIRSMLFNLQVFWDFPAIFLLLISCLILVQSKGTHCMIPILLIKFVNVCFTTQDVVYLGEHSM